MENIKKTSNLHRLMTLPQAVEYFATQKAGLTQPVSQVPLLEKSWLPFTEAYAGLETAYKHAAASPLTPELVGMDGGRGNEFLFMNVCVNNVLLHSTIAEEVAAARVLELEMNNHAGLPRLDYEAETAATDDLIDKFKAPAMAAALARLGLTPHLAAFEQFNTDFKAGYRARLDEAHARRLTGTASKHSRETSVCFNAFCIDVTSLGRLLTDPAQLSVLSQIAASINAVTEQFTIIVDRHHGIHGSKGNHQKPDITNPEVPGEGGDGGDGGGDGGDGGGNGGDGFEAPDISNPPPFGE